MGIQTGSGPLPFGHAPEAAVGIEGLEVATLLIVLMILNLF